jgi:hypothetical protein
MENKKNEEKNAQTFVIDENTLSKSDRILPEPFPWFVFPRYRTSNVAELKETHQERYLGFPALRTCCLMELTSPLYLLNANG